MMDARATFLIILLVFLFLSPNSEPSLSQREEVHLIQNEWHMLSTLNNTSYGDFDPDNQRWLNTTGLRAEDGYPWPSLRKIKERISDIIDRRFYAFPQTNLDTRNHTL